MPETVETLPGSVVDFLFDQLIRQQFEHSIAVIDISWTQISIGDPRLSQESQSIDNILNKSLHILEREQPIGIEPTLQQLIEGSLRILQEQQHAIIRNLDAAGKGSRPQFQDALMLFHIRVVRFELVFYLWVVLEVVVAG